MHKEVTLDELNADCGAFLARLREVRLRGMERPAQALSLIGGAPASAPKLAGPGRGGNLLAVRAGLGRGKR